jgi:tricorn protease-like protein
MVLDGVQYRIGQFATPFEHIPAFKPLVSIVIIADFFKPLPYFFKVWFYMVYNVNVNDGF